MISEAAKKIYEKGYNDAVSDGLCEARMHDIRGDWFELGQELQSAIDAETADAVKRATDPIISFHLGQIEEFRAETARLKEDNRVMANCLKSIRDAGWSYSLTVNAAIERTCGDGADCETESEAKP